MTKTETARDVVTITATVVATAATVYVVWKMAAGPDAQREMVMQYYHKAREHAKAKAEFWNGLAEKYGNAYINAGMANK